MPKDLRKLMQEDIVGTDNLSKNHRRKFEMKLKGEIHSSSKRSFQFLKVAASFLILVGVGFSVFYFSGNTNTNQASTDKIEGIESISPEFKKIENYYLANINTQISNLEETKENRELLDGYFEKIGELSADYKKLTVELNTNGLNENTVNALIDNLQLRLKLLYQLKEQLKELKKLNKSENESIQI